MPRSTVAPCAPKQRSWWGPGSCGPSSCRRRRALPTVGERRSAWPAGTAGGRGRHPAVPPRSPFDSLAVACSPGRAPRALVFRRANRVAALCGDGRRRRQLPGARLPADTVRWGSRSPWRSRLTSGRRSAPPGVHAVVVVAAVVLARRWLLVAGRPVPWSATSPAWPGWSRCSPPVRYWRSATGADRAGPPRGGGTTATRARSSCGSPAGELHDVLTTPRLVDQRAGQG
ncbi:hypothetical protein HBB16_20085 [Pseudonocardia sp. MCCB 268]|nr:hypothetical protein [Pseudonocardia cytotoxica]